MTWKTPSGALVLSLVAAVGAILALGCAESEESKVAMTALEDRVGALEQRVEALSQADRGVVIKVKGTGAGTELSRVIPDQKKVCREGGPDCPTEVTWRLGGSLEEGWSVVIREKANSDDKECFLPPDGQDHWTLVSNATPPSSGPSHCDEGAVWEYDVILMQGNEERDRIDPLFYLPF